MFILIGRKPGDRFQGVVQDVDELDVLLDTDKQTVFWPWVSILCCGLHDDDGGAGDGGGVATSWPGAGEKVRSDGR